MKFSENWLRQHVKTSATRDELAATLTAIGLEVEEMTVLGEALDGVVVARIVECAKHPEADKLQVCQVDAGTGGLLQIVCGAPNARPGLVAPLATIGTQVGALTIKAAKLRGVESNGMLCSAKELGLDADASGLLELPADAPVGTPLADYLGLPDASIELKLTPNRADCFGVRGIAYDVAAACGGTVAPYAAEPVAAASATRLDVALQAGADAPRFVGRVVEGVDAAVPTPAWIAERLAKELQLEDRLGFIDVLLHISLGIDYGSLILGTYEIRRMGQAAQVELLELHMFFLSGRNYNLKSCEEQKKSP